MNAVLSPRVVQGLMLAALCLAFWSLSACTALAADAMPTLQANIVFEFVSDRARMIQVSLVVVALGCAIMWWYR